MFDLYQAALDAGFTEAMPNATMGHHESDLYLKCGPKLQELEILYNAAMGRNCGILFISQIDKCWWKDFAFAYTPFWKNAEQQAEAYRHWQEKNTKPITEETIHG